MVGYAGRGPATTQLAQRRIILLGLVQTKKEQTPVNCPAIVIGNFFLGVDPNFFSGSTFARHNWA